MIPIRRSHLKNADGSQSGSHEGLLPSDFPSLLALASYNTAIEGLGVSSCCNFGMRSVWP